MKVLKLSADARATVSKIIAQRKVGLRVLSDEQVKWYQQVLDSSELWDASQGEPVLMEAFFGFWRAANLPIYKHFFYQNCLYHVTGRFTPEQEALLVKDAFDAERRKFERLKHKFESSDGAALVGRLPIPEQTRIAVWRRDSGRCTRCGSRERLEYDHIIPLSQGGSNTARNIELLCEACNRSKGAEIG